MKKYKQLKIKENGRVIFKPTPKKENRIKVLQRYQKKLLDSNDDLPVIAQKIFSYVINKEIVSETSFIKEDLNALLTTIINAYREDYSPVLTKRIKGQVLYDYIEAYDMQFEGKENIYRINTIKEIQLLHKNPYRKYKKIDYKNNKID